MRKTTVLWSNSFVNCILLVGQGRKRKWSALSVSHSESAINADLLAMVAAFSPDISLKVLDQEIDLSPLPKHRVRRKEENPFPRICKNDIRRLLPAMLVNVMNSADCQAIQSFFETYFVPSCYKFRNLKDPWMTPSLEKLRSKVGPVIGRSHLIKGMELFCSLPDIIVKLKGSCVQHTPDGPGSKVIMSTECINSFIDETLVEYTDKDGIHKVTNSYFYECMLLSGWIEPSCCVRKHLVAPGYMERTLQSVIIFHLDNLHRIYCIEVIGQLERTPKSF